MRILKLSDGRKLSYDVYGDPNGQPVIFSHGFSDSSLIRNPDEALTKKLGVKIIAADQPGVGESSPRRGRKMADWGKDMEELADHLGLAKFAGTFGRPTDRLWRSFLKIYVCLSG